MVYKVQVTSEAGRVLCETFHGRKSAAEAAAGFWRRDGLTAVVVPVTRA